MDVIDLMEHISTRGQRTKPKPKPKPRAPEAPMTEGRGLVQKALVHYASCRSTPVDDRIEAARMAADLQSDCD